VVAQVNADPGRVVEAADNVAGVAAAAVDRAAAAAIADHSS